MMILDCIFSISIENADTRERISLRLVLLVLLVTPVDTLFLLSIKLLLLFLKNIMSMIDHDHFSVFDI
jgi:hypothetical protein